MAKGFNLILGTRDSENVLTTETIQVRAGNPHFDPPQVGFTFPPNVAPRVGVTTGPYWPVGEYWGFAFCRVVPTPSGEGTGRFFVQYYYESGNWPNSPSRKFHQTFDGTATTTNATLYNYTTDSLLINSGGGDPVSGFASSADVSGLRHALVITNADLSYVYEGRTGDRAFRTGGDRAGFRNPGTDDVIATYKHDLNQEKLFTIERLERASGLPSWSAGAQIIQHPYHYVPLYQNNGAVAHNVLPRILVIEEGAQFPLTGLFHVNGDQVSGQFSKLLDEVISGTQMAVRFTGDATWYLVSGVLSSSGMVIYSYGQAPSITSGSAEAVPYALGSGLISIGPGLVGCANWDISFTPDVRDGDGFPNLSSVTFTAGPIEIAAGGAPSGTLSYVWQVQPQGGAITTITNSGSQINVDFTNSATTPIDVRVFASGTGQPTCIHSDSTGYITLKKLVTAGTFACQSFSHVLNTSTYENESGDYWRIKGANIDMTAFFHHQFYSFEPYQALLNGTWTTTNNYISVQKGQIDSWPTRGTFVVATTVSATNVRLIYGIYSGKQTNTTDDRLTGISIVGSFLLSKTYQPTSILTTAGTQTVSADPAITFIYVPVPGNWPMSYVTSRVNNTLLMVENDISFDQRSVFDAKQDVWFFKPGQPIHTNTMTTAGTGWNQLSVLNPLPSWVDTGVQVALAPWDSQRTGNQETKTPSTYWNRGNMSFLYISLPAAQQYVQLSVGGANLNRIYCSDATKRASTGTLGSMPRYTWIPPQGRLVVPSYDRTKTLIFSYTNWVEFNNGLGDETQGVYFDNCALVQINGSATSGYLQANQMVFPYKEVKLDPIPYVFTVSGLLPNKSLTAPGLGVWTLGFNAMIVDVVKANSSPTNPAEAGSEGTPQSQPIYEKFITNFPTNGMPATDGIYRKSVPGSSTGTGGGGGDAGGGCLVGWTIVTIKHQDGFAKEVPISEVVKGDMICSMDRSTYAMQWCKVTDTRALEAEEAFELLTVRGRSILVTGKHPIASCNEKQWTPVEELEVGTWIETEDGPDLLAEKKLVKDSLTVYDLTVDDLHTFIAGGILVHNKYKQNVL